MQFSLLLLSEEKNRTKKIQTSNREKSKLNLNKKQEFFMKKKNKTKTYVRVLTSFITLKNLFNIKWTRSLL